MPTQVSLKRTTLTLRRSRLHECSYIFSLKDDGLLITAEFSADFTLLSGFTFFNCCQKKKIDKRETFCYNLLKVRNTKTLFTVFSRVENLLIENVKIELIYSHFMCRSVETQILRLV